MGPKPRTPRTSSAASESTVSKASSSGTPTRRTRIKTTTEIMDDIDSVSKGKDSLENESKELAAALSTELASSSSNKQVVETTDIVTGEKDEQSKEGDDEESNEDEDIYEMEQIISHKKGRDGKILYRVRWKGYTPEQDTWEPVDNFIGADCKRLLVSYWEKCKKETEEEKKHLEKAKQLEEENTRIVEEEKRVKSSTIPRSKTPILTKEDMDTENDTVPTSSAIFQREKSSDTSESNESVGDVLFGINIDKGHITREQQRLMIHDRKLDETEKALISLQSPSDGTRLTRNSLRKIRGSSPPPKVKRDSSGYKVENEPKKRQSRRSQNSLTPKLELPEEKAQIKRTRKSGKKSATPVALEKKDEPAEKKEKLEETKVDIEEKPEMLKGQEIMKIEAGSKKTENAFNEAGEKTEILTLASEPAKESEPSKEPKPAKEPPTTLKPLEKVPEKLPKVPIKKEVLKAEKPKITPKPKAEPKKVPPAPEKIPLPPNLLNVAEAKTPLELKAEMMKKKKFGGTDAPVLKKSRISSGLDTQLKPTSSTGATLSASQFLSDVETQPQAKPEEIRAPRRSTGPPAKSEEILAPRRSTGSTTAKKPELNETPPEEPKPKIAVAQRTGHRDLSADLPMEVTQGVKLEDFVMTKIRESNQTPVIELTQREFEEDCLDGRVEKIRSALRFGSNGLNLDRYDDQGRTILHQLCANACDLHHSLDEIIDILKSNGADLNLVDLKGRTPLHIAIVNRSICHVRKLLSLRVHMNVEDKNGNLPIWYASDLADTAILTEILNAGAAYHRVKHRHQKIKEHDARLLDAFNDARNKILVNMYVEKPVTTIFVNTFWEKPEIVHHFTLDQIYFQKAAPQAGFLLTLGIADFSANKSPRVRMWGDLGISKVSLNDKELEPISEGCRYTYALGNVRTKNVLKMTVNSNFINNASKILSQIVFVQINNNGKSATTRLTGQPPTYRPNSGKGNNTPQY